MNNRKLFMMFAAYAISASFVSADQFQNKNTQRLYNNIIKNINEGKSNDTAYKLIEDILNKKNKDLKSLYLQNDYIIKPEFLEWQIFFTGYYNHAKRGDNTLESALYYSNPKKSSGTNKIEANLYNKIMNSGLSDKELMEILSGNQGLYSNLTTEQKYLVDQLFNGAGKSGNFKPYQKINDYRTVDLGIMIDMKYSEKIVSEIQVSNVNIPTLNLQTYDFVAPEVLNIPQINIGTFNSIAPIPNILSVSTPGLLNLDTKGSSNGDITGFFPYGDHSGTNGIISQMDLHSGEISVITSGTSADPTDPGYYDYTLTNLVGSPAQKFDYDSRYIEQSDGSIIEELAVLPSGVYTNSIKNNYASYKAPVQGIIKVVNTPILRVGDYGANVSDLKITLEGNVINPDYVTQIIHYNDVYFKHDPVEDRWLMYTLSEMESEGWITTTVKNELADKFLDTSLGHTVDNRLFQYVENNGTLNLKGSNVAAVNLQTQGAYNEANSFFMNRGEIIGLNESSTSGELGKHIAYMFSQGFIYDKQEGFDNTGRIELRAPESILYHISSTISGGSYIFNQDVDGNIMEYKQNGKLVLMNSGDMKIYGRNSIGVYTQAMSDQIHSSETISNYADGTSEKSISKFGFFQTEIQLNNPITVLGDQSIGLDLERVLNYKDSKLKIDVGTEDPRQNATSTTGVNGLENSGNITNAAYTDNSMGAYINLLKEKDNSTITIDNYDNNGNIISSITRNEAAAIRFEDYLFNIGSYSRNSIGIVADQHVNLTLGSSSDPSKLNEINLLAGGENNVGIYTRGSEVIVTTDGLLLNIDGNRQVGVQAEDNSRFYHKNGIINVNGTNNTGIAVVNSGYAELNNSGVINVGNQNVGVYNDSIFNMLNGSIIVNGGDSAGVYSAINNTTTNIHSGSISAANGGVALYAGAGSVMNIGSGINLISKDKGLMFYNQTVSGVMGQFNLLGTVSGTVEKGGSVFYVKDTTLGNYMANSLTGNGILDLIMQSGSKIYVFDATGQTLSLSSLDNLFTPSALSGAKISINAASATDYIPVSMSKGKLILDRDINLDATNDLYGKSEFGSTKIELQDGKTISGTQANQIGMIQKNYRGTTGVSEIEVLNNGTIDLRNTSVIGLGADFGTITNNGIVRTIGDKSIGIYSTNGSKSINNNELNIGGSGSVGIFATSYFDGATNHISLGYGNDTIDVTNNGKIISQNSNSSYGIYADNVAGTTGSVVLTGNSNIDMSASNNSVGIFVNNTTLSDTGSAGVITVGTNGAGVYAKDSNVTLNNLTMNLTGNNALGFSLEGNTVFNGNGTINVTGTNAVLFNILTSGTFNQNFNIVAANGASYVIGNVKDISFHYNGVTNLSSNSSLINAKNSEVLLDTGANISSTGENTAVAIIDGQYLGAVVDGENRGVITLGDKSAGIYGKNDARIKNSGSIVIGNQSLGLHTTGTGSSIENTGNITIGEVSTGMYGENSQYLQNTASGIIQSSAQEAVGIYSAGTSTTPINNMGTIKLDGNKSTGIYSKTLGTINNTGTISIGDSLDERNPGIGIYSEQAGNIINNNNIITAGNNSVGIYSIAGVVNHNGNISTGDNGIGIYSDGALININSGSTLTQGINGAIGVYTINGSNIINNSGNIQSVNNDSYAYALKSGSNLINNSEVELNNKGVFVYGNGLGTVTNNAKITINGSENIAYYTVNGGNIYNNQEITATTGTGNIGIYNQGGYVENAGELSLGDSYIEDKSNSEKNKYSVGIYGDNSTIKNTGKINLGYYGVGIYALNGSVENHGMIESNAEGAIGLFVDGSTLTNYGEIILNGENSIGIYARNNSTIYNHGNITMGGNNSSAIYLNSDSKLANYGILTINGDNSQGILIQGKGEIINDQLGTININPGTSGSETTANAGNKYPIPSLINSGVINVSENFEKIGMDISIKVDASTISVPTVSEDLGASFVSDAVKFYAPEFNSSDPIGILPGFASGTHAEVYKLKDVFNPTTDSGGPNSGVVKVRSKSLTWLATPVVNERGNVDIWLQKIPYDNFTSGLWYEDFGQALDTKYVGSTGEKGQIFDKIDTIELESDFRRTMSSLAGDIYANMNQRETTIADIFDESLSTLQNSKNNTKENIKLNVIAGKGRVEEDTDGVVNYDYRVAGIQALREVERTYAHTFGYSLGYTNTSFEFRDGSESKETANTLQLGLHNKYSKNSWTLKNDLTGRVSFYDIDRNIKWSNATEGRLDGSYETYSITSNNSLGKEFILGKNTSFTPYGGMKLSYLTRPSFSEKGLESLEVKGNDAWSLKPKVGVELTNSTSLGRNDNWKLKSSLDVAYEYELGEMNNREKAKLTKVEDNYHKLSKASEDRGILRTKASIGVEVEDRYGIFLNGEYKLGENNKDEYRAGVSLKAVF